ncbi:MAG: 3-oxoacyl-ACP reductase family protein [Pseudomonadota bacterium]
MDYSPNGQSFAGRTALITGGARGIGRAIAYTLATGGARVAVNYRSSRQDAEETVNHIHQKGGTAIAFQSDVSEPDQVERLVREVNKAFGPVELLVNNAAVYRLFPSGEQPLRDWEQTLKNNLTSAYLMSWAVKDSMIERRFGRIVHISSIAALRARPHTIAYAVSKAGLIALTRSCAKAWARYNVRVNAVAPGLINTELIAHVDPKLIERQVGRIPVGRIGQPEDVASAVAFLLSEKSDFMTGQTLVVSGGDVMLP